MLKRLKTGNIFLRDTCTKCTCIYFMLYVCISVIVNVDMLLCSFASLRILLKYTMIHCIAEILLKVHVALNTIILTLYEVQVIMFTI